MLLPTFDYHAPATMDEAGALLNHYGVKAKVLAGGTDLLVNLKKKLLLPEQVISLNKIEGLKEISLVQGDGFYIGPLVTAVYLAESKLIQEKRSRLMPRGWETGIAFNTQPGHSGGKSGHRSSGFGLGPSLIGFGGECNFKGPQRGTHLAPGKFHPGAG